MTQLWWITKKDGSLLLADNETADNKSIDSGVKAHPGINRLLTAEELETIGDIDKASSADVAALAELVLAEGERIDGPLRQ